MKLRIKDNSIRLRLTRPEVDTVALNQRVEGVTVFADAQKFIYALQVHQGTYTARFSSNELTVYIPEAESLAWAGSDRVGLEHHADGLHLLIEKDFTCLQARPEEQGGDFYPNPLQEREQ